MINLIEEKLLVQKITRKHNKNKKVPIWLMRQAGRYLPEYHKVRNLTDNFLKLCYTPKLATELTLQPIIRFDLDAAIMFSDILVTADALGCEVKFIPGKGPVLSKITTQSSLKRPETAIKTLEPIFEMIKNVRAILSHEKSLIGFAGAPWTVATYMIEGMGSREYHVTKKISYDHKTFSDIINKIVEITCLYLEKQIENGIDAIQIFDSHAGIASVEQFKRWIIEPTSKISSYIHKRFPGFPIIGFPKGAGSMYNEYSAKSGVSAISIDYSTPLEFIKENTNLPIQGNLDPYLLAYDQQESLKEAKRIIDFFRNIERPHIFNLGHGIIPNTPVENVQKLVEFVKNY